MWRDLPNGDKYQGEVNGLGQRDGKGITVSHYGIQVGHHKNGYLHGIIHNFQKGGSKTEGYYKNGKLVGTLTFFYADGIKERYRCNGTQ